MDIMVSNTKIKLLQQKIDSLSTIVESMKIQMKEMDEAIKVLKTEFRPIRVLEPTKEELSMLLSSNDLHVDDSESDGYDSDVTLVKTRKIRTVRKTPSRDYVLIDRSNDSGYEDSDCDDAKSGDMSVPLLEETRLDPLETDRITEELKQRALLLEEV